MNKNHPVFKYLSEQIYQWRAEETGAHGDGSYEAKLVADTLVKVRDDIYNIMEEGDE